MRVNIIIPCYNEAANLWRIRTLFIKELKNSGDLSVKLILVENGSIDNSRDIMASKDFAHPAIEIAEVNVNKGYGYGIKKGIRYRDAEVYCWTHADLQTPLNDVLAVIKAGSEEGSHVVAGKRVTSGAQKLQSFVFDTLASFVMGCGTSDINGQPKVFGHEYKSYFTCETAPSDFSLDMYFFKVFKELGQVVDRHPVRFLQREFGEAKGGQMSFPKRFLLLIKMLVMASRLRGIKIVDH